MQGPWQPEPGTLPAKMVEIANRDGLPATHLMRIRAAELDARLDVEVPGWTAQGMIGAWARARHAWHNYTGEAML